MQHLPGRDNLRRIAPAEENPTAPLPRLMCSALLVRSGRRGFEATAIVGLLLAFLCGSGISAELSLANFNSQGLFNNLSGDSGAFANGKATISGSFDTRVFHGQSGASLRMQYSVISGFCGIWNSLLGKDAFPQHSLNFTNLYGALRNSSGNPSRIENVHVTHFSFWARGDGTSDFEHQLKVDFKNTEGVIGSSLFTIPNSAEWKRYEVAISQFGDIDLSAMKEIVFVIESWRNNQRVSGTLYVDDLAFTTDESETDPSRWSDDGMLDAVSHRAFFYFLRFTDELGFALDRSTFSDMVSVGTIGFQLSAYCIGHQRHWADPHDLESRVLTVLQNLENIQMGSEPGLSRGGHHGFYYHFLAANMGRRKDANVEVSLYDTMLLMYGVLTCKEYFVDNPEIQRLSQALMDGVEWDWFVDHRPGPNQNQFYLDWHPEPAPNGTFHTHVDGQTDEALMLDVLALGSRTHPVPFETYLARTRVFGHYPQTNRTPVLASWRGSLFNYFFASCWLNFESRGIDLHPVKPVDLWQNNKLAIEANRQFCIDHSSSISGQTNGHYSTYGPNAWGLTACDNLVAQDSGAPSEYFSFGALPSEENIRFGTKALHAGTISVYGAASSINYTPAESLAAIRHYLTIPGLWNPLFGFGDAFNLDPHYLTAPYDRNGNPTIIAADYLNGPWINPMIMGINVGPMLLSIENYRSGFLWKLAQKNPEIVAGLDRIFGIATMEIRSVAISESGAGKRVRLEWKSQPDAKAYDVFTSADMNNWELLKAGIQSTHWTDEKPASDGPQFYLVKAVSQ